MNERILVASPVIAPQVQPQFSRQQLTQSIILPERPERVLTKVRDHRQEIIDYHRQSGNFPRPFSFALSQTGVPRPRRTSASSPARSSMLNPNANRASHSSYSSIAASSHYSVISSVSSYTFGSTNGTQKRVRQIFEPVLPDELVVRLDEKVTLVQSFDDGWCVVGRDVPLFAGATKSLYKSPEPVDANIELGVVPAWCFMRPVKGLRAERPVRSSSLGITVQMDNPAFSSRNEIMSWSNF
ncbi:hypothetical protein FISHEDRAFT_52089 [Fistulina hepatica ATCC 64428]|nr:hypothetical protein FISHEDRAFT_52089 [Fistulina hepatica ATCC 64428]